MTPVLQKTLAQFLSMFGTLAQAGLIPVALATSQIEGGAQTPTAHTLEQRDHVGQVLSVMPTQPVSSVQPVVREITYEEEQLRLARFKK